ncbi:MAG TPA: hypothetical protein VMZ53_27730 [Kofleriaceae bacterium]|nr:hypothetical protein [Kofleriaceae bacterium]
MRSAWLLAIAVVTACAAEAPDADHDEVEDFIVDSADGKADGVPATFDANNVVDDALLTNGGGMSVADVQAFFEKNPYGTRSWLASYKVNGVSAAQMVVEAAQTHDVNPLILIARMQVETSLVSKTATPSERMINRALGCGCPDGASCNTAYSGLQRQLDCGARTLRRWYDASIDGSGQWRKGVSRSTLDPRRVTPGNHATATFYAYTPWVLVGSGGTWLAWNVTRKYVRYAEGANLLHN